jgi:hypothetical protein
MKESGRRKMEKKKKKKKKMEELLLPFSFFNHLLHLGYPFISMFLAKTTRLDYLPSMRIL